MAAVEDDALALDGLVDGLTLPLPTPIEEPLQPFPFLALPFDLRHRVYQFVLHTKDSICPDVTSSLKLYTYHSEKRKEWYENHSIIDVALLRTCRQIHREAAAVLYGSNSFTFDDWDYREKCVSRRHHSCRCPGETDMNLLATWLHLIGPANRRCLRRIRIILSHPAYMLAPGEPRFLPDAKDQRYTDEEDTMPQGQHLVRAFRVLALEHSLRRLKIEFDNKAKWGKPELVRYFFHNGLQSSVVSALSQITGLHDIAFDPMPEAAHDEAVVRLLRQRMCRPRPCVNLGDSQVVAPSETIPIPFSLPEAPSAVISPTAPRKDTLPKALLPGPELLSQRLLVLADERQEHLEGASKSRERLAATQQERVRLQEELMRLGDEVTALQLEAAAADRRVAAIDQAFTALAHAVPDPLEVQRSLITAASVAATHGVFRPAIAPRPVQLSSLDRTMTLPAPTTATTFTSTAIGSSSPSATGWSSSAPASALMSPSMLGSASTSNDALSGADKAAVSAMGADSDRRSAGDKAAGASNSALRPCSPRGDGGSASSEGGSPQRKRVSMMSSLGRSFRLHWRDKSRKGVDGPPFDS